MQLTIALLIATVVALVIRLLLLARQLDRVQHESSQHLYAAVDVCKILLTERGGSTERAARVARDFCRYNPPDVVLAAVLHGVGQ